MKTTTYTPHLILSILLFSVFSFVNAQDYLVIKDDTTFLDTDSVYLSVGEYRGQIQWQATQDSMEWVDIEGANTDTLFVLTDSIVSYRVVFEENTCNPIFSDTVFIFNSIQKYNFKEYVNSSGDSIYVDNPLSPIYKTKVIYNDTTKIDSLLFKLKFNYFLEDSKHSSTYFTKNGPIVDISTNIGKTQFDTSLIISLPYVDFDTALNTETNKIPVPMYLEESTNTWMCDLGYYDVNFEDSIFSFTSDHLTNFSMFYFTAKLSVIYATLESEGIWDILDSIVKEKYNCSNFNSDHSKLIYVIGNAENELLKLSAQYEECQEHFSCEKTFGDAIHFANKIALKGLLHSFTHMVGAGVSKAVAVKIISATSVWIINAILADCIVCFLSESYISSEFWLHMSRYVLASFALNKIEEYKNNKCNNQQTGTLTDQNGNTYKTVKIGNQTWMAENLKATKYADGTPIPHITDNTEWGNLGNNDTDKAYCFFNNDESLGYGALYTYAAATNGDNSGINVQGVCPTGWHLPSDAEWKTLEMHLGMSQSEADDTGYRGTTEGNKLKATSGWIDNGNGTDEVGFSALAGGYRYDYFGTFSIAGYRGLWWSSTQSGSPIAYYRYLYCGYSNVYRSSRSKSRGYSVRCLRD